VHHAGLAADLDSLLAGRARPGSPSSRTAPRPGAASTRPRRRAFTDIAAFSSTTSSTSNAVGRMVMTTMTACDTRVAVPRQVLQRKRAFAPVFLAPNYQMTELQGAVALAQLERVMRFRPAQRPGLTAERHSCRVPWRLHPARAGRLPPQLLPISVQARPRHAQVLRDEFSRALAAEGVPNARICSPAPAGVSLRHLHEAIGVPRNRVSFCTGPALPPGAARWPKRRSTRGSR